MTPVDLHYEIALCRQRSIVELPSVVGRAVEGPIQRDGFVWDGTSFTLSAKPNPGGRLLPTQALGINDNGAVVGYYAVPGPPAQAVGYLLKDGLSYDVACAGAAYTYPQDINNKGTIVGCQNPPQGFITSKK
jgi:hypothetical protein